MFGFSLSVRIIILIAIISNQEQNNSIENITKPLEQTISSNSSIINQENKTTNININNTNNKTQTKKNQRKYRRPPPIRSTSKIPNDTSHLNNNDVYSLNDLTFDMVLKGGNNYKWLVILYSETCGHCEHARREIRKVFPSYKNSTSIRFAEIEINKNYLTNMRFDKNTNLDDLFKDCKLENKDKVISDLKAKQIDKNSIN